MTEPHPRPWYFDPLVAFLAIGVVLFVISDWFTDEGSGNRIEITRDDLNRIEDQWRAQMRRAPTLAELDNLVEQYVREEVYYREAVRLGLGTNDTIVRRRLVQKLTFLTEDIATAVEPQEAELQAFFNEHSDEYREPPQYSFRHRYFSSDRRKNAEGDALAGVADPQITGDPFMLQKSYAARSTREIGDLFGREFATSLAQLPAATEAWQGPIKSAYGWHAVQLTQIQDARIPEYAEVARRVLADWQMQRRKDANQAYFKNLMDSYTVHLPPALDAGDVADSSAREATENAETPDAAE